MSRFLTVKKHKLFIKICALFLSLLMTVSEPLVMAQNAAPVSAASRIESPAAQTRPEIAKSVFSIPEELGMTETFRSGNSGKTILLIQDAHDSLEAQENIAGIIEHVVRHDGVRKVFEEGYEGPVPTDEFFDFIKDPELKRKVSYFLMDQLRLGGAEYAHINRHDRTKGRKDEETHSSSRPFVTSSVRDFQLIGADSIKAHLQNIEAYKRTALAQKEFAGQLEFLDAQIRKLADKVFTSEMKSWIKLRANFYTGKADITQYVREIERLRGSQEKDAVSLIVSAMNDAAKGDSFKTCPLLRCADELTNVSAETLTRDLKAAEDQIAERLLHNSKEKELWQYYLELELLMRLTRFEISSDEFLNVKKTLLGLDLRKIARFSASEFNQTVLFPKNWRRSIREAVRFYRIAGARDRAVKNALRGQMRAGEKAVIVFGGFHRQALEAFFKSEGYSYAVVTPRISSASKRHQDYYKALMTGGFHDFEIPIGVARAAAPARLIEIYSRSSLQELTSQIALARSNDPALIRRALAGGRPELRGTPIAPFVPEGIDPNKKIARLIILTDFDGVHRDRSVDQQIAPSLWHPLRKLAADTRVQTVVISGSPAIAAPGPTEPWYEDNAPIAPLLEEALGKNAALYPRMLILSAQGGHTYRLGDSGIQYNFPPYSDEQIFEGTKILVRVFLDRVAKNQKSKFTADIESMLGQLERLRFTELPPSNFPLESLGPIMNQIRAKIAPQAHLRNRGTEVEFHAGSMSGFNMSGQSEIVTAMISENPALQNLAENEKQVFILRNSLKISKASKLAAAKLVIAELVEKIRRENPLEPDEQILIAAIGDEPIDMPMYGAADLAFHVGKQAHLEDKSVKNAVLVRDRQGKDALLTVGTREILPNLAEAIGKPFQELRYFQIIDETGAWKWASLADVRAELRTKSKKVSSQSEGRILLKMLDPLTSAERFEGFLEHLQNRGLIIGEVDKKGNARLLDIEIDHEEKTRFYYVPYPDAPEGIGSFERIISWREKDSPRGYMVYGTEANPLLGYAVYSAHPKQDEIRLRFQIFEPGPLGQSGFRGQGHGRRMFEMLREIFERAFSQKKLVFEFYKNEAADQKEQGPALEKLGFKKTSSRKYVYSLNPRAELRRDVDRLDTAVHAQEARAELRGNAKDFYLRHESAIIKIVLPVSAVGIGILLSVLTKYYEKLGLPRVSTWALQFLTGSAGALFMAATANYLGQYRINADTANLKRAVRFAGVIQIAFVFWFIAKPLLRISLDAYGPLAMVAADTAISLYFGRFMIHWIYRADGLSAEARGPKIRERYWIGFGVNFLVWGIVNWMIYGIPKSWAFVIPAISEVTAFTIGVFMAGFIYRDKLGRGESFFWTAVGVSAPVIAFAVLGGMMAASWGIPVWVAASGAALTGMLAAIPFYVRDAAEIRKNLLWKDPPRSELRTSGKKSFTEIVRAHPRITGMMSPVMLYQIFGMVHHSFGYHSFASLTGQQMISDVDGGILHPMRPLPIHTAYMPARVSGTTDLTPAELEHLISVELPKVEEVWSRALGIPIEQTRFSRVLLESQPQQDHGAMYQVHSDSLVIPLSIHEKRFKASQYAAALHEELAHRMSYLGDPLRIRWLGVNLHHRWHNHLIAEGLRGHRFLRMKNWTPEKERHLKSLGQRYGYPVTFEEVVNDRFQEAVVPDVARKLRSLQLQWAKIDFERLSSTANLEDMRKLSRAEIIRDLIYYTYVAFHFEEMGERAGASKAYEVIRKMNQALAEKFQIEPDMAQQFLAAYRMIYSSVELKPEFLSRRAELRFEVPQSRSELRSHDESEYRRLFEMVRNGSDGEARAALSQLKTLPPFSFPVTQYENQSTWPDMSDELQLQMFREFRFTDPNSYSETVSQVSLFEVPIFFRRKPSGHIFMDPMPGATYFKAYYDDTYGDLYKAKMDRKALEQAKRASSIQRVQFIESQLKRIGTTSRNHRVLDVGAAWGYFLDEGRKAYQWQPEAAEIEPKLVNALRQLHIPVYDQGMDDPRLDDKKGSYDLVLLKDLIEHLPEPEKAVRRISSLLNDGQFLFIETPLILDNEVFAAFQHVQNFSLESLTQMLEENGFEIIRHAIQEGPPSIYRNRWHTPVETTDFIPQYYRDMRVLARKKSKLLGDPEAQTIQRKRSELRIGTASLPEMAMIEKGDLVVMADQILLRHSMSEEERKVSAEVWDEQQRWLGGQFLSELEKQSGADALALKGQIAQLRKVPEHYLHTVGVQAGLSALALDYVKRHPQKFSAQESESPQEITVYGRTYTPVDFTSWSFRRGVNPAPQSRVLVLGGGSGVDGIAAAALGAREVAIVERNLAGAASSEANAARSPHPDKFKILNADIFKLGQNAAFQDLLKRGGFDHVYMNMPLVSTSGNDYRIKDHDFGLLKFILKTVPQYLNRYGTLEIMNINSPEVLSLIYENGWIPVEITGMQESRIMRSHPFDQVRFVLMRADHLTSDSSAGGVQTETAARSWRQAAKLNQESFKSYDGKRSFLSRASKEEGLRWLELAAPFLKTEAARLRGLIEKGSVADEESLHLFRWFLKFPLEKLSFREQQIFKMLYMIQYRLPYPANGALRDAQAAPFLTYRDAASEKAKAFRKQGPDPKYISADLIDHYLAERIKTWPELYAALTFVHDAGLLFRTDFPKEIPSPDPGGMVETLGGGFMEEDDGDPRHARPPVNIFVNVPQGSGTKHFRYISLMWKLTSASYGLRFLKRYQVSQADFQKLSHSGYFDLFGVLNLFAFADELGLSREEISLLGMLAHQFSDRVEQSREAVSKAFGKDDYWQQMMAAVRDMRRHMPYPMLTFNMLPPDFKNYSRQLFAKISSKRQFFNLDRSELRQDVHNPARNRARSDKDRAELRSPRPEPFLDQLFKMTPEQAGDVIQGLPFNTYAMGSEAVVFVNREAGLVLKLIPHHQHQVKNPDKPLAALPEAFLAVQRDHFRGLTGTLLRYRIRRIFIHLGIRWREILNHRAFGYQIWVNHLERNGKDYGGVKTMILEHGRRFNIPWYLQYFLPRGEWVLQEYVPRRRLLIRTIFEKLAEGRQDIAQSLLIKALRQAESTLHSPDGFYINDINFLRNYGVKDKGEDMDWKVLLLDMDSISIDFKNIRSYAHHILHDIRVIRKIRAQHSLRDFHHVLQMADRRRQENKVARHLLQFYREAPAGLAAPLDDFAEFFVDALHVHMKQVLVLLRRQRLEERVHSSLPAPPQNREVNGAESRGLSEPDDPKRAELRGDSGRIYREELASFYSELEQELREVYVANQGLKQKGLIRRLNLLYFAVQGEVFYRLAALEIKRRMEKGVIKNGFPPRAEELGFYKDLFEQPRDASIFAPHKIAAKAVDERNHGWGTAQTRAEKWRAFADRFALHIYQNNPQIQRLLQSLPISPHADALPYFPEASAFEKAMWRPLVMAEQRSYPAKNDLGLFGNVGGRKELAAEYERRFAQERSELRQDFHNPARDRTRSNEDRAELRSWKYQIQSPLEKQTILFAQSGSRISRRGGKVQVLKDKKWPQTTTGLARLDKEFAPAMKAAGYAEKFSDEVIARAKALKHGEKITAVYFGAGDGTALMELKDKLQAAGVFAEQVRLVGYGDMIFDKWEQGLAQGIEFIWDTADHFSDYFKPGEIDILFSFLGLYHLPGDPDFVESQGFAARTVLSAPSATAAYYQYVLAPLLKPQSGFIVTDFVSSSKAPLIWMLSGSFELLGNFNLSLPNDFIGEAVLRPRSRRPELRGVPSVQEKLLDQVPFIHVPQEEAPFELSQVIPVKREVVFEQEYDRQVFGNIFQTETHVLIHAAPRRRLNGSFQRPDQHRQLLQDPNGMSRVLKGEPEHYMSFMLDYDPQGNLNLVSFIASGRRAEKISAGKADENDLIAVHDDFISAARLLARALGGAKGEPPVVPILLSTRQLRTTEKKKFAIPMGVKTLEGLAQLPLSSESERSELRWLASADELPDFNSDLLLSIYQGIVTVTAGHLEAAMMDTYDFRELLDTPLIEWNQIKDMDQLELVNREAWEYLTREFKTLTLSHKDFLTRLAERLQTSGLLHPDFQRPELRRDVDSLDTAVRAQEARAELRRDVPSLDTAVRAQEARAELPPKLVTSGTVGSGVMKLRSELRTITFFDLKSEVSMNWDLGYPDFPITAFWKMLQSLPIRPAQHLPMIQRQMNEDPEPRTLMFRLGQPSLITLDMMRAFVKSKPVTFAIGDFYYVLQGEKIRILDKSKKQIAESKDRDLFTFFIIKLHALATYYAGQLQSPAMTPLVTSHYTSKISAEGIEVSGFKDVHKLLKDGTVYIGAGDKDKAVPAMVYQSEMDARFAFTLAQAQRQKPAGPLTRLPKVKEVVRLLPEFLRAELRQDLHHPARAGARSNEDRAELRGISSADMWTGHLRENESSIHPNDRPMFETLWQGFFSKLPRGLKILDAASGNGFAGKAILKSRPETQLWAVDLADVDRVKLPQGVHFVRSKLEDLASADLPRDFDAIVSQYGVEYSDWKQTLPLLAARLKTGGKMVYIVHHAESGIIQNAKEQLKQIDFINQQGLLDAASDFFVNPPALDHFSQDPRSEKLVQSFLAVAQRHNEIGASGKSYPYLMSYYAAITLIQNATRIYEAGQWNETEALKLQEGLQTLRRSEALFHERIRAAVNADQVKEMIAVARKAGLTPIQEPMILPRGSEIAGWIVLLGKTGRAELRQDLHNPARNRARSDDDRAELRRQASSNLKPSAFNFKLAKEAVFVMDADVLSEENMSELQWNELLILKNLNRDKLHIHILENPGSVFSERMSSLMGFGVKVSYGPDVPNLRPMKIVFSRKPLGISKEKFDASFGLFDGAFSTALLYAEQDGNLEGLVTREGLLYDPGLYAPALIEELMEQYEMISASA